MQPNMEAELFTSGGMDGGLHNPFSKPFAADKATREHLRWETIQALKLTKWVLWVVLILLVLYVIANAATVIPLIGKTWRDLVGFRNKEGLQYLGASTSIVRGDLENNSDSLAEQAYKKAQQVTDMSAPANFTERILSPEEKELDKIKATT